MNKENLSFLLQRPIAVHPVFIDIAGSPEGGFFLSQLFYWSDKGADQNGWIHKTAKEWESETRLKRRGQERARKELKNAGVMQERLAGNPAKMYYRIIWPGLIEAVERLSADKQDCTKRTNKNARNEQTSLNESDKLSLTETTTENTTETDLFGSKVNAPEKDVYQGVMDFFNKESGRSGNSLLKLTKDRKRWLKEYFKYYSKKTLALSIRRICKDEYSIKNNMVNIDRLIKPNLRDSNVERFGFEVKEQPRKPIKMQSDDELRQSAGKSLVS